ncbi:MAG: heme biosynthesis HemY N-terminal domain-containing protein [Rickettsiales bacterium]|nr:heme biosynthesis HemY N-terminal domain-containing protein [Rickettsiales bacterium]
MSKILTTIIAVLVIILLANWFALFDGKVDVLWLGYKIETSVFFIALSFFLLFLILYLIYNLFKFILGFPSFFSKRLEKNILNKNLENLQYSVSALLSGDNETAKKYSSKLQINHKTNKNIAIIRDILETSIAQNDGNLLLAEKNYQKLLEQDSTRFFATQGLLNSSFIKGDINRAIEYAEDAYKLKPNIKNGAQSLLALYKKAGNWQKAEEFLKKYKRKYFFFSDKNNNFSADNELSNIYFEMAKEVKENRFLSDENIEICFRNLLKSISYNSENEDAILMLAEISLMNQKTNIAKSKIEKLWLNKPSESLAKAYLSLIIEKNETKNYTLKQKAVEKLKKINPDGRNYITANLDS